jgi:hypothetical protein
VVLLFQSERKQTRKIKKMLRLLHKRTVLATLAFLYTTVAFVATAPNVYYASLGDTVTLQCSGGGGPYACFSTYTLQNQPSPMVALNMSAKYQIQMGLITITQVQATDAGFYACSGNCNQMQANQISWYLQPMCMLKKLLFNKN